MRCLNGFTHALSQQWNNAKKTNTIIMKKITILLAAMSLCLTGIQAQGTPKTMDVGDERPVAVVSSDESETSYLLSTLRKITIEGSEDSPSMRISFNNGTPDVTGVSRVVFGSDSCSVLTGETGVVELDGQAQEAHLFVFPNPVHSQLDVRGVPENAELQVYNLGGQLMMEGTAPQVNVSRLPAGTYLLRFGNSVVKFVKN